MKFWELLSIATSRKIGLDALINLLFVLCFRWTIPCLSKVYLKIPLFYIEDVHTSGFLAEICNIPRRHFPHFVYEFNMTSTKKHLAFLKITSSYTYHYVDQDLKKFIYNYLNNEEAENRNWMQIHEIFWLYLTYIPTPTPFRCQRARGNMLCSHTSVLYVQTC